MVVWLGSAGLMGEADRFAITHPSFARMGHTDCWLVMLDLSALVAMTNPTANQGWRIQATQRVKIGMLATGTRVRMPAAMRAYAMAVVR